MWRRLPGLLWLFFPLLILIILKRFASHIPATAALSIKLYPVAINLSLLASFGYTLIKGPSAIERLARLKEPNLGPKAVAYTRSVTKVWCVFFLLNGLTAAATAFWMSVEAWALYNGVIAYVLMGCLFAVEWVVRQKVKKSEPSA